MGIPFLYQKVGKLEIFGLLCAKPADANLQISSATPVTALISVRSPVTSFTVLHLNGTVDWMVAQRRAILAWTGHALGISPTINTKLVSVPIYLQKSSFTNRIEQSIVHWGSSKVTGRGLLALVGDGQVYSVTLKAGEQWIAHPRSVNITLYRQVEAGLT